MDDSAFPRGWAQDFDFPIDDWSKNRKTISETAAYQVTENESKTACKRQEGNNLSHLQNIDESTYVVEASRELRSKNGHSIISYDRNMDKRKITSMHYEPLQMSDVQVKQEAVKHAAKTNDDNW